MINFVKGLSKHTTSTLFLGVLFLCVISLRYVNDFFKAKNRSLQKKNPNISMQSVILFK